MSDHMRLLSPLNFPHIPPVWNPCCKVGIYPAQAAHYAGAQAQKLAPILYILAQVVFKVNGDTGAAGARTRIDNFTSGAGITVVVIYFTWVVYMPLLLKGHI